MLKGFWRYIYYWPGPAAAISGRCGDQLLCAGCGLGDGRVAPVHAKWLLISLSMEKHNGFGRFYPDASRCLQFPPYPRRVADASPRFHFWSGRLMKKSLEKWSEKYAIFVSKMEAKWVHKFEIIWIMPSMHGEHYRSRQHVSKNDDKSWSADPEKLDFHVPSRAKTQLPLFHIYQKCHQLDTQMGLRLVRVDALRRES